MMIALIIFGVIWGIVIFIGGANYLITYDVYDSPEIHSYHITHRRKARRQLMIALALPVVAPRAIYQGMSKAFAEAHKIKFFEDEDEDE